MKRAIQMFGLMSILVMLTFSVVEAANLNIQAKQFMQIYDQYLKNSEPWSPLSNGYAKQTDNWAIALYLRNGQVAEVALNIRLSGLDQASVKQAVYPIALVAATLGVSQDQAKPLGQAIGRTILTGKLEQMDLGETAANLIYHGADKIIEVHFLNAAESSDLTDVTQGRVIADNTGVKYAIKDQIQYLIAPVADLAQVRTVGADLADSFSGEMKILFVIGSKPVMAFVRQGDLERYFKPDLQLIQEIETAIPPEAD